MAVTRQEVASQGPISDWKVRSAQLCASNALRVRSTHFQLPVLVLAECWLQSFVHYVLAPANLFLVFLSLSRLLFTPDLRDMILLLFYAVLDASFRACAAAKQAKTFRNINSQPVHVLGQPAEGEDPGAEAVIPRGGLLRGHLVSLHAGETVPADGLLVEGELVVNEVQITGEATPQLKRAIRLPNLWQQVSLEWSHTTRSGSVSSSSSSIDDKIAIRKENLLLAESQVAQLVGSTTSGARILVLEVGSDCLVQPSGSSSRRNAEHPDHSHKATALTQHIKHSRYTQIAVLAALSASLGLLVARAQHQAYWRSAYQVLLLLNAIVPLSLDFHLLHVSHLLTRRVMKSISGILAVNLSGEAPLSQSGPFSIVLTDKTGTLTQNRELLTAISSSDGTSWIPVAQLAQEVQRDPDLLLHLISSVRLSWSREKGASPTLSDSVQLRGVEGTLLRALQQCDALIENQPNFCVLDPNGARYNRLLSVPFSWNLGVALHVIAKQQQPPDPSTFTLHILGMPERVWEWLSEDAKQICHKALNLRGGDPDSSERDAKKDETAATERGAERLFGYANCPISAEQWRHICDSWDKPGFSWAPFVATATHFRLLECQDALVPDVPAAVQRVRDYLNQQPQRGTLGLLTGDRELSALSVACQVGLLSPALLGPDSCLYLRSLPELAKLDANPHPAPTAVAVVAHGGILSQWLLSQPPGEGAPQLLARILDRPILVVYRASPQCKELLVRLLQTCQPGRRVAVIGDGANDIRAIAAADLGIGVQAAPDGLVHQSCDVVIRDWVVLPTLLQSATQLSRVSSWALDWLLARHLFGASALCMMLFSSRFTALENPVSPFVATGVTGALVLVVLWPFCYFSTPNQTASSHRWREWKTVLVGAVAGLLLGSRNGLFLLVESVWMSVLLLDALCWERRWPTPPHWVAKAKAKIQAIGTKQKR